MKYTQCTFGGYSARISTIEPGRCRDCVPKKGHSGREDLWFRLLVIQSTDAIVDYIYKTTVYRRKLPRIIYTNYVIISYTLGDNLWPIVQV
ncbi:hypothetical protein X801_10258, partial [Opisthorchis viverrini]